MYCNAIYHAYALGSGGNVVWGRQGDNVKYFFFLLLSPLPLPLKRNMIPISIASGIEQLEAYNKYK
jgi:hypothetical protein